MSKLPKSQFQTALLIMPSLTPVPESDSSLTAQLAKAADVSRSLPLDLTKARQVLKSLALDVLLIPDTFAAPEYFLSLSRIAPVQATLWSRGFTTGMPWSVDYHISSAVFGAGGNRYECASDNRGILLTPTAGTLKRSASKWFFWSPPQRCISHLSCVRTANLLTSFWGITSTRTRTCT